MSHTILYSYVSEGYKIISRIDRNICTSYVSRYNFGDSKCTKHKVSVQIKGKKLSKFYVEQYGPWIDQNGQPRDNIFKIYLANTKCVLCVSCYNNPHENKVRLSLNAYHVSKIIDTCSKYDIGDTIEFYKKLLAQKCHLNNKAIREIVHI